MSWSLLLLSWPVHMHIVLVLALDLGCELAYATECRHSAFIVDSSNLDAGITYSGGSWAMDYDDPSEGVYFYGGSTMRAYNPGDSVEFSFTGNAVAFFGDVGTGHARFSVEIDGYAAGEGTAFSVGGFQTRVPLWRKFRLQEGQHRLRVIHDDISGKWLSVDKFLYRKNETDMSGCPTCNPPDSPNTASTQVQTSLDPESTISTITSYSSSPASMCSVPCTSSSSTLPDTWDSDPPSSITSPAITPPENAVPYITYSTISPSASAAAVVTLNSMTVGAIIGITIGGTALGMAIVVCCFYAWRHRRIVFKDRRKSLATQTIKSEYAPTITPYHWPPANDPNSGLGPSKPVPEMMSFANTLPESVAEVETASEQEVDLEASLPPMSPVRPTSTGTMTHSMIVGEVPIGLARSRPGISMPGSSFPTTPHRISFSPFHSPHVPRSPSSPNSWGFPPSSPTFVQGGRLSPVASSHSDKTGKGDKIDRTSAWGYWDRLTMFHPRSGSPVSRKTNETERSRKFSNSLFSR